MNLKRDPMPESVVVKDCDRSFSYAPCAIAYAGCTDIENDLCDDKGLGRGAT